MGIIGVQLIDDPMNILYDVKVTADKLQDIHFSDIWKPIQNLSDLTILNLETCVIIFLVLVIFHFFATYILKHMHADGFKRDQRLPLKFFHILTQVCNRCRVIPIQKLKFILQNRFS